MSRSFYFEEQFFLFLIMIHAYFLLEASIFQRLQNVSLSFFLFVLIWILYLLLLCMGRAELRIEVAGFFYEYSICWNMIYLLINTSKHTKHKMYINRDSI